MMGIPRRVGRLNLRVKMALRQAVELAAQEMGCSVSEAARALVVEGLASWNMRAKDDGFASVSDLMNHLAVLEARAGKEGGAYALGRYVEELLRRHGPKPPRS